MPKVTYIEGKEPHELERRLIFRNIDRKGWNASLKKYVSEGGYKSLEKSLRMEPGEVTQLSLIHI